MTLVSSFECLLLLSMAGLIWWINQYLIVSGTITRLMRIIQQQQRQEGNTENDNNLHLHSLLLPQNHNLPTSVHGEDELDQVYDFIYRRLIITYLESEELRTWVWLMLALLLNIICISIELSLFEDLAISDQGDD